MVPVWDAIVLAGGRARRLGGIDKPAVDVGGRTLLEVALDACPGARDLIVVGPRRPIRHSVTWTRETPPGGGPVAALAAGVAVLRPGSDAVAVLAADLPAVTSDVVGRLVLAGAGGGADGAVAVDDEGRVQPLLAVYRRKSLESAIGSVDRPAGLAISTLIAPLRLVTIPAGVASTDIDTPEDLRRWQTRRTDMDAWITELCAALDVPRDVVDVPAVLDVARDAAHNVERPAAPVTTFVLGYAAARRSLGATDTAELARDIAAMARDWGPDAPN